MLIEPDDDYDDSGSYATASAAYDVEVIAVCMVCSFNTFLHSYTYDLAFHLSFASHTSRECHSTTTIQLLFAFHSRHCVFVCMSIVLRARSLLLFGGVIVAVVHFVCLVERTPKDWLLVCLVCV